MSTAKVEIGVEVGLGHDFHLLRSEAYATPGENTRDEFDHTSLNIFARVDGVAAGTLRLDLSGLRILRAWSLDSFEHAELPGDCTISRAAVSSAHRGMGLYRAMVERAIEEARRASATRMLGVITPSFPLLPYLESLGFSKDGILRYFENPPHGPTLAHILTLMLRK